MNAIHANSDVALDSADCATDILVVSPDAETPHAHALVTQARLRLIEDAAQQEIESLRQRLASMQANYSVQLANAEQARRVTWCLRAFHEKLLHTIAQPILMLDREGCVQNWNAALATLLRVSPNRVAGQPLATWIAAPTCETLLRFNQEAFRKGEEGETDPCALTLVMDGPLTLLPGISAERILLLPLSRIPGWVEATVALIELDACAETAPLPLAA